MDGLLGFQFIRERTSVSLRLWKARYQPAHICRSVDVTPAGDEPRGNVIACAVVDRFSGEVVAEYRVEDFLSQTGGDYRKALQYADRKADNTCDNLEGLCGTSFRQAVQTRLGQELSAPCRLAAFINAGRIPWRFDPQPDGSVIVSDSRGNFVIDLQDGPAAAADCRAYLKDRLDAEKERLEALRERSSASLEAVGA